MGKNAPTVQSENAPKRVKMAKNCQKWPKMAKKWQKFVKIDFLYNNFPEKVISLRKCTKKNISLRRKKVKKFFAPAARILVMCGDPPRGGGVKKIPPHSVARVAILYASYHPGPHTLRGHSTELGSNSHSKKNVGAPDGGRVETA